MNRTHIKQLAKEILMLQNEQEVLGFLKAILTPNELSDLVKRLQIIKRLKSGQSQRQIAEELGVGIATVTRGSKEIQKGNFKNV